jgi:flagellar hook-length control protein FliK
VKKLQNSVISTEFLIPQFMGALKSSKTRETFTADDTFMNMLSERIAARNNDRSASLQNTGTVVMKDGGVRNEVRDIKIPRASARTTASSGTKASGTKEVKASSDTERAAVKEEKPKEKIEEEIETLEALIALLEELLARLETVDVQSGTNQTSNEIEAVLSPETENISPMELLMALAEGNIEKLKALVKEMSTQNPEINDLVEKIRDLIEKLEGSEEKDFVSDLLAELVVERKEPSQADAINELKAKCGQVIQKLKEQVSKLKEQASKLEELLAKDTAEDTVEQIMTQVDPREPEKVRGDENESKQQSDSGEDGKKADVSDKSPEFQVIDKTSEEAADKFIFPNNQDATAPPKEIQQAERIRETLPQKPPALENTVTNQVVMKVKLMAGENRQEMEMQLKPESLGKLSLKIIHERGEILARITAENEQVKEILESNMQLLKDALEKNGFSIQSLSVSVSNDREENRTKEDSGSEVRSMAGSVSRSEMKTSSADIRDIRERIEKEYFGQSYRINLTA